MGVQVIQLGGGGLGRVVAVVLIIVLVGVLLYGLAFTDAVSTDMEGTGGGLSVYLIDKDGNVVRVINPSSPLAVLPLAFVYQGQEFAYIKAVVRVEVNASVQYWYTVNLHLAVYKWVEGTWGYWDKIAEDTLTRTNNGSQPTSTDELVLDFNIYPSAYISAPQSGDHYKIVLWADVVLEGVNGMKARGNTNGAVVVEFDYEETQWLSIVRVVIEPVPQ